MPTLNTFECYVELAESGFRLNEYDTIWAPNAVECYVVIPNQPSAFQIRLSSTGYFSPALSASVYIDGILQCNRFKRGLLPPSNDRSLGEKQVEFKFKSKDYSLQGGRMISHPWRFEKLNIVAADSAADINSHVVENLGVIEVVILRCSDNPADPFDPWVSPRLLRTPTTDRRNVNAKNARGKQSSGEVGSRFDGPSDDPFRDYPYWVDGRGVDRSYRRHGYSRPPPHTRPYGNAAYDAPRHRSYRRLHTEQDWSPDDRDYEYESTDEYLEETAPRARRRMHPSRQDEDIRRRSHRRGARAPSPLPAEYRSYPRNGAPGRSGDKDQMRVDSLYEAFQAGLHLGAKQAQSHLRDSEPPKKGVVSGIVINQFPDSRAEQVETAFDPDTRRRAPREGVYDEPIQVLPPRSRSPARIRRATEETLIGRLKNLITGYEERNAESGPTSKRSSFHSYVEEVVDEEYGGKSAIGMGNNRELLAIQPPDEQAADGGSTSEIMPMPGAFPFSGPPKGLIEGLKQGFEATIQQTTVHDPRAYGKLSSMSENGVRSQKERESDARISSWVDGTQTVALAFKRDTEGKADANYTAHIGSAPKVSFEDHRGRGRSRQRSPHRDRGASHDRRRCSVCEQYRRHHSVIHSNDSNNRHNHGGGGWEGNGQWDYDNQARSNWQNYDQSSNPQNGWDKSNTNNDGGWGLSNELSNRWENNDWNSNLNDQWGPNAYWDGTSPNKETKAPEPAAANDCSTEAPPLPDVIEQKKEESPKTSELRSTQRTKEQIESISKPREYWHKQPSGTRHAAPASPSNSSRKRSSAMPAEPLHAIPAAAAAAKNVEHQVRGGEGVESTHKVGHPVYWDSLEKPFAVFRFRYRSRRCLEAILGENIAETPEELRGRLAVLSREELIQEVLRRKDGGDAEKPVENVTEMKWD